MTVSVTRSGGILGAPTTYHLEADSLEPTQMQQLKAMLQSLPPGDADAGSSADSFQYDISASDVGMKGQWRFFGDPNPASQLIEFVKRHA